MCKCINLARFTLHLGFLRAGRPLHNGQEQDVDGCQVHICSIGRYHARTCDVAALLNKHPNSITKWLNRGLRLEREDPAFKRRVDALDEAVSGRD